MFMYVLQYSALTSNTYIINCLLHETLIYSTFDTNDRNHYQVDLLRKNNLTV